MPKPPLPPYDAVVLAGGAARRLGGADKPSLTVGDTTLLDRVLAACAAARRAVVVGPRRPTGRPVTWAREDPPGGGPLPALAAGVAAVTADVVVVLAADLPFLTPEVVRVLVAACTEPEPGTRPAEGGEGGPRDGAVLVDADRRDQPLAGAYRTESLRRELGLLHAEHGTLAGLPLRLLTAELGLRRVPDPAGAAFDCDTWEDLSAARARMGDDGSRAE